MERKTVNITLIPGNLLIVVFLIMFVMKLLEVGAPAEWSWWIITAPLWFIPAVIGCVWVITVILMSLMFVFYKIRCLFD